MRKFLVLFGCICTVSAETTVFQLIEDQSAIVLSGVVAGSTLEEQSPGSLASSFAGSLQLNLSESSVQILGGTLDATVNGNWAPAEGGAEGVAPADFGGKATTFVGVLVGALRSIVLEVSSPEISMNAGSFPAGDITFAFPENSTATLDYRGPVLVGNGSKPLGGLSRNESGTVGTISGSAGSRSLRMDVDATFYYTFQTANDTVLRIKGLLVGTEQVPSAPRFAGIVVQNNEVRLTVDNAGANAVLQSSTDLESWVDRSPAIQPVDEDTVVYILPVAGQFEFYRIVQ